MSETVTFARSRRVRSVFFTSTSLACVLTACVSQKKQTDLARAQSGTLTEQDVQRVPRPEAGQGLVWFPFVWSPVIVKTDKESASGAVNPLSLRNPKLVFKNTLTKAEVLIMLRDLLPLPQGQSQASYFSLPRVFALSEGEYSVESIRTEVMTPGNPSPTFVEMPFVNPFQSGVPKPLIIKVREGKIAAIARVAQTTTLTQTAQGLSLKSVSENIDADVVPVSLVRGHLNNQSKDSLSSIVAGSSDFPRLRVELTNNNGQVSVAESANAKIGFLVDAPCAASGRIRLIWKRLNDDKEYLAQFPVKAADANCKESQNLGFQFALPVGDWSLKSTFIAPENALQASIQTPWLQRPETLLADYFSLNDPSLRWSLETQKEREIRRAVVVPLESVSRSSAELRKNANIYRVDQRSWAVGNDDTLFLGHFEIKINQTKNDLVAVWDFILKTGFELDKVRRLLGAKNIFNAYSLEKLTGDRAQNTQIILRTASSKDDQPGVAPVAAELQAEARKVYADCIKEREESDPLSNLATVLRFTVLRGSDGVNLKSHTSTDAQILSENWLESCLKKRLIGFRFSKKSSVNFQGELKFGRDNEGR